MSSLHATFLSFSASPLTGHEGSGGGAQIGAVQDAPAVAKWLLIATGVIAIGTAVAIFLGRRHEAAHFEQLTQALGRSASQSTAGTVSFDSIVELPSPVARYFRHVLTEGQPLIRTATIHQSGTLRTSTMTENWSLFTARHLVLPPATGFVWNARVRMPLATHVRVLDSYIAGIGSGRVSVFSALAVASEAGAPELNSGALHRYLAEAVWYPTALLPQSGVMWSPIDEHSAMAKLTDSGTTVSLEFRFNEAGEVTAIYTPGRFGRFDDGYKQVPWEGRFRNYHVRDGMRVPLYGEVGWYDDKMLQLVWKGSISDARYEFGR